MFQVDRSRLCYAITVLSKKLWSPTLHARFRRDSPTYMSVVSFIVILRVPISLSIIKGASRYRTLVFPRKWTSVSRSSDFRPEHLLISCYRGSHWCTGTSSILARFRLLDGSWSREAKRSHPQSGYMECWLLGGGDAYWRASLGLANADASYFQGRSL